MTLQEAIVAMQSGKKVKLPEWEGYWFMIGGQYEKEDDRLNVRVFTKTGDVLDTPWFDKYDRRDDFEITSGALGFDFALRAMKAGKKVKRANWTEMNGSLQKTVLLGGEEKIVVTLFDGKYLTGWSFPNEDVLANDWVIVFKK
jgi:hypothetical protein